MAMTDDPRQVMPHSQGATLGTAYGSDAHGLVWGYLFLPQQNPQSISCSAALEWLATAADGADSGFVWLHFSLSNAAARDWLRTSLQLPEAFHAAMHAAVGSTRLELEDDALVAVVHDVLINDTFDSECIATLTLSLQERLAVSARLRPLRSVDRLRGAVAAGRHLRSPGELLSELMRDQAMVLGDIVRTTTIQVDGVEDNLLASRASTSRSELGALRRAMVRLQRLLAPEPSALFRLLSHPPSWITADDAVQLREASEEFSAAVADSGALAERLKLLQEELVSMINEHTNRTLFILTLVTVLALPINLVAGLLGMNVGGIPLAQHAQGFLVIVCSLAVVTGALAYFLLLRRRD
jgi:zinc transporter